MTTFFCPACWAEVPDDAERCTACGADLAALDLAAFDHKLVRALSHPEPLTARRAAEILGRRGSRSAVPALLARYRAGTDPYFAAEIARALGRIGGAEAEAALREMGAHPSPIVKYAVEEACTTCRAAATGTGTGGGRAKPGFSAAQLRAALLRLEALAQGEGALELVEEARLALEPLERGEVRVVVMGQFKRGKTSVVNALLGEAVLPVGVVPLTSVITLVRYGARRKAEVVFAGGRRERIEPGALARYVTETGKAGNRDGVLRVEVELPAGILASGLVLVDTPGIGSLHRDATQRALDFLPRIDAAIFVLSPDPPISRGELEYLQAISRETEHLFFVLTKIDLFPEAVWRESRAYSGRAIAEVLGRPPDGVEIWPVASPWAPAAERARGAEHPRGSGFAALSRALATFVDSHGPELIRATAARRLRRAAEMLSGLLDLQEAALRSPLEELAARLAALEGRIEVLRRRRDEARALLEYAVAGLARDLEESLQEVKRRAAGRLASELKALIREVGGLSKREVAARVDRRISEIVTAAFEGWREGEGSRLEQRFREEMERAADLVDRTLDDLREQVTAQFGVRLPPPPRSMELIESPGFYYLIEGTRPRLLIQELGFLLLPGALLRRNLLRRAWAIAEEELDRNAGRLRSDLAYRIQDTARRFLARLEEHAAGVELTLQASLERTLARRCEGETQTAEAFTKLAAARAQLRALLHPDGAGV